MKIFYLISIILIACCSLSCVSQKKYNTISLTNIELRDSINNLSSELLLKTERNLILEKDIQRLLQVNGLSISSSLTRSLIETDNIILDIESCINNAITVVADNVDQSMKKSPISGTRRVHKRINDKVIKNVYVASGFSEILSTNPKYETVVYIVQIIEDNTSNDIVIDISFVPLVSSSSNDPNQLLFKDEQVNDYITTIDRVIRNNLSKLEQSIGCITIRK